MLSLKKIDSLYPLISQNSRIYKEKQKELKQKEVLDNLYSLPLDIKIKIYQMAMSTHLKEWTNDHKSISWSLRRKLNPNEACCADLDIWNFIELEDRINTQDRDYYKYSSYKNTVCSTIVRYHVYDNLEEYKIDDDDELQEYYNEGYFDDIFSHEWSNKKKHYWTHKKCRCFDCDLVRITYCKNKRDMVKETPEEQKIRNKYKDITVNLYKKRWKIKTEQQVKKEELLDIYNEIYGTNTLDE